MTTDQALEKYRDLFIKLRQKIPTLTPEEITKILDIFDTHIEDKYSPLHYAEAIKDRGGDCGK